MLSPGLIWNSLMYYILLSLFGSLIPVNIHFRHANSGVEIYIVSNGVHTDFVIPIRNEIYNWSQFILVEDFGQNWNYANHIAFGWGDQGFYLNTPEWKDLRPGTALKAVLIPSSSAMHVTLWNQPEEDTLVKKITITEEQYLALVTYITKSFKLDESDHPNSIAAGYGSHDLFYDGKYSFHLFRACNTWTNDGLKVIGVRACWWTFYDRAILWQISKIEH